MLRCMKLIFKTILSLLALTITSCSTSSIKSPSVPITQFTQTEYRYPLNLKNLKRDSSLKKLKKILKKALPKATIESKAHSQREEYYFYTKDNALKACGIQIRTRRYEGKKNGKITVKFRSSQPQILKYTEEVEKHEIDRTATSNKDTKLYSTSISLKNLKTKNLKTKKILSVIEKKDPQLHTLLSTCTDQVLKRTKKIIVHSYPVKLKGISKTLELETRQICTKKCQLLPEVLELSFKAKSNSQTDLRKHLAIKEALIDAGILANPLAESKTSYLLNL